MARLTKLEEHMLIETRMVQPPSALAFVEISGPEVLEAYKSVKARAQADEQMRQEVADKIGALRVVNQGYGSVAVLFPEPPKPKRTVKGVQWLPALGRREGWYAPSWEQAGRDWLEANRNKIGRPDAAIALEVFQKLFPNIDAGSALEPPQQDRGIDCFIHLTPDHSTLLYQVSFPDYSHVAIDAYFKAKANAEKPGAQPGTFVLNTDLEKSVEISKLAYAGPARAQAERNLNIYHPRAWQAGEMVRISEEKLNARALARFKKLQQQKKTK